jgi:elongation factor P
LSSLQRSQARGPSHYKMELREIGKDGSKVYERFNAGSEVETINLTVKPYEFMYTDGNVMHLVEQETFEQIEVYKSYLI